MAEDARWYVVHTYSGYENKVKANIEKIVENRKMQDYILDIVVPMEEQIEIKDGKKKDSQEGFSWICSYQDVMTDDSWYVVRNTRGVTGLLVLDPSLFHYLTMKFE